MSRKSVLFVCLGNICRSPLAEGAMRAAVRDAGIDLHIDSAGTGDWHIGSSPDNRAIAVAKANGVDISGLRGRQVSPADFYAFGHIYALDENNLRDLESIRPADATASLSLLLDHVPGREGGAVADPYYGDDSDFAETWKDVSVAAQHLVQKFSS